MRQTGIRNPNHPKRGSSTKVYPIFDLSSVEHIKTRLADNPRNLCIFVLGINTGLRANEIVSLKVGQVSHLDVDDALDLKQSKNKKYRLTTLNQAVVTAIQHWLAVHPDPHLEAPLFTSFTTGNVITPGYVCKLVKGWCREAGLNGNYGSHSLRKTWGYHQRIKYKQPTPLLQKAFGHKTEAQTLEYLCIQPNEIKALYMGEL